MVIENVYRYAAVATSSKYCAPIGRDILKKGGSCVDACIACLLCEGILSLQNAGVGGGHMMIIYKKDINKCFVLNARECAPLAAYRDMFIDKSTSSTRGILAAAVPGELLGFWEAHKKFGILPWEEIFQPAINFALNGFPLSDRLIAFLEKYEQKIMESPSIRDILAPNGILLREGENMKLPALGKTFQTIASSKIGSLELYQGSLTQPFISDIKKYGGIITEEDMASYRVRWSEEVSLCSLRKDLSLHSVPCPGSGVVLALILRLMNKYHFECETDYYKVAVEAFKHGYALRSHLGDPFFTNLNCEIDKLKDEQFLCQLQTKIKRILVQNKTCDKAQWYGGKFYSSDKGTVSTVVISKNGDAVAATSSINLIFGCLAGSPETGIILNSQMDDFCQPGFQNTYGISPSVANLIEPGKRPLSSMCPSIVIDSNRDVKLAVAAAGGIHIISAIALVIMNYLWLKKNLCESIESPRVHHQLLPMHLKHEKEFSKEILAKLEEMQHEVKYMSKAHSAVVAICRQPDRIIPVFDHRREGSIDGF